MVNGDIRNSIDGCIQELVNFRYITAGPLKIVTSENEHCRTTLFVENTQFSVHVHMIPQAKDVGSVVFDKECKVKGIDGYSQVTDEIKASVAQLKLLQEVGLMNMQAI